MLRKLLRSKLHRVTVTRADLHYQGSISIDENLMEAAEIVPFEAVQIWNVNNGQRFETYAIPAARNSGEICLNGSAARRVAIGDILIVAAFGWLQQDSIQRHTAKVVLVDEFNQPRIPRPEAELVAETD